MQNNPPKSAYIHIPFCRKKCNYCAFTSFTALNLIDEYIKALTKEIKHFYKGSPLKTLYIGGGTPSLLNLKHFEKILGLFKFTQDMPEITVEVNPESADLNLLSGLYKLGVNRISIGIQSFDDDILQITGRLHSSKRAKDTVYLAQDIGFENINIDLIYGLPQKKPYKAQSFAKEAVKHWEETLKTALTLDVQHISLYGLKIEENTPFYNIFNNGSLKILKGALYLPDDDIQADMYKTAIDVLTPVYELYEVSNFAKSPKYRSLHNLNYWNEGQYFGFGVSAAGFSGNTRYQNTKNFKEYVLNPIKSKETTVLNNEERLEETIFLGFRKMEGINIKEINAEFSINFDEKYGSIIKKFMETGHILKTKNGYKLSVDGVLVSNSILSEFLL